jgi:hypothetical protein
MALGWDKTLGIETAANATLGKTACARLQSLEQSRPQPKPYYE